VGACFSQPPAAHRRPDDLDAQVEEKIPAFSAQWNKDLSFVWSVDDAAFTFTAKKKAPARGSWWVVFLDNSDQANALAYRDLTNEGLRAGEVCDPVEADEYGYDIGGILVTDFVTPNWFGHEHATRAIDFKSRAHAAFEVLTGGYAQKYDPRSVSWQQVTGAKAMKTIRDSQAAVGSRRERRARGWKNWELSGRKWG
jgi:hypothetical protein